jgi:hypothetical protein
MSFLKGFFSLFDWMFPSKSYQELSDDLDNRMQELYDRNGWGKYNNPLNDHWYAKYLRGEPVEYHGSISEFEKLLDSYKPGQFIPYAIYNKHDDSLTAHFKDGEYVSILLNDTVTVFKSNYGGEIIGCRIHNINKLTK